MKIAVITGSGGLIGSQSVKYFSSSFDLVIGIDNNQRSYFFGEEASTLPSTLKLSHDFPNFKHYALDIRNQEAIFNLFNVVKTGLDIFKSDMKKSSELFIFSFINTDITETISGNVKLSNKP